MTMTPNLPILRTQYPLLTRCTLRSWQHSQASSALFSIWKQYRLISIQSFFAVQTNRFSVKSKRKFCNLNGIAQAPVSTQHSHSFTRVRSCFATLRFKQQNRHHMNEVSVCFITSSNYLAKLQTSEIDEFLQCHLPTPATFVLESTPVYREYATAFREARLGPVLKNHIMKHNKWSAPTFDNIQWRAHKKAFARRPLYSRIRLIKVLHDWLPIGNTLVRINTENSPKCPSCPESPETTFHIIRCETRETARTEFLQRLTDLLESKNTPAFVSTALINGIKGWFSNANYRSPLPPARECLYLRAAVKFQNDIGWGELFKGRISSDFQRAVISRLAETHVGIEYTTQQKWTVPLITLLIDTMELFWSDRNQARHGSAPEEEVTIRQVIVANKSTIFSPDSVTSHDPLGPA